MSRHTTARARTALAALALTGAAVALSALPAAADNHSGSVLSVARVTSVPSGDATSTTNGADDHHVGSMEL
ncbi:hypothetical protein GCM10020221_13240 [Streptomyces thioluteus]|uniref:Uncharacterized protein n=1 Tax=Streptomyces thioluteus TaxID=66431 RepID=A0ABN3WLF4_STRTU